MHQPWWSLWGRTTPPHQRLYQTAALPCPPLHQGPSPDPASRSHNTRQLACVLHSVNGLTQHRCCSSQFAVWHYYKSDYFYISSVSDWLNGFVVYIWNLIRDLYEILGKNLDHEWLSDGVILNIFTIYSCLLNKVTCLMIVYLCVYFDVEPDDEWNILK